MNLLKDPWIPVRADGGSGPFRLLTYQQLLCETGSWQVSIPRDDLELACVQLLVCMTQVMFLPEDDKALRTRIASALSTDDFAAGLNPCQDWFDLDHPTQPFMQSRRVKAEKVTPIQKILVGLPEGNNHAFFNEVGEVKKLSSPLTAIALFNQASNANSMGGGFKGNLRGGSNPYLTPVSILVNGSDLRQTVWRNVLTLPRIQNLLPGWQPDFKHDQPTWVKPIHANECVKWNDIGLVRGLFWQPTRLELVHEPLANACDVLEGTPTQVYSGFLKEKFKFTVDGLWPHPHGARAATLVDGRLKWKFSAFNAAIPAWTQLTEFVVSRGVNEPDAREGSVPSGPVSQAGEMGAGNLHLLVGGYCASQASIVGRRHELISLAQGWLDGKDRLPKLVAIGKDAKKALRGKLYFAVQGNKDKGLKGIGAAIHETAEKRFYARTESLIHEAFSNELTWKEWSVARSAFAQQIAGHCLAIFSELTDSYASKPELIPIISWARQRLKNDLDKLEEGA
ncbi:MAG: type I-E CRISPR-associated protein Cse1/CasA [Nitrospira sp.]|nr:type I-E CRISPR-associated protein Cse1/CasA [Nitrospira sp.]